MAITPSCMVKAGLISYVRSMKYAGVKENRRWRRTNRK